MPRFFLPVLFVLTIGFKPASAAMDRLAESSHWLILSETKERRPYPHPLIHLFRAQTHDNRRLIAACLAFPLPVGFLGVHRIFLGTKPYIPVLYAGTLGGCLGIIPLSDFWAIIFSKDIEQYLNNPKFFMWIK